MTSFFETPHSRIAYTDSGPPGAHAILLLHGFPLSSGVFDVLLPELTSTFRVITPDMPGFGQSSTVGPFSMTSIARDCVALMTSLKIGSFAAAGLSMGGYVALEMAASFRDLLSHLILIDTKASADDETARDNRDSFVRVVREKGGRAIVDLMMPKMLAPTSNQLAVHPREQELRDIMQQISPLTIEYASCAMRDRRDFTALLASMGLKTQVIVGEHDAIISLAVAKQTADACGERGARLDIIPDAGHMAPFESPVQVAKVMREFLITSA